MTIYPNGMLLERGAAHANPPLMHSHQYYELFFLLSGQRRYFVDHTIYDVAPGNLVIIPRTQLHRTASSSPKVYERYLLNFYESDHSFFVETMGRDTFDQLMHSGCLEFPAPIVRQLHQTLEQLERELSSPTPYTRALAAHLLQEVLLTALCHGTRKIPCSGENISKVQQVARYISLNYAQPFTLQEAAQMAYMEKTYFSKRFKALTGFGFLEYLTQTRLRAAEQLLRESQLSISQIAERCGFCSGNYFGDIFRRFRGLSPSEFRKAIEAEERSNTER